MGNNDITTIVQKGETIGLYSAMYGCTDEDIKKANKLNSNNIKVGQTLKIPIGQEWQLPTSNDNVLDKKLSWFNDKVNDVHMQLYNPDLKSEDREKLEKKYVTLMNQRKERNQTAEFTKSQNGVDLVLTLKKDISVSEFRELFPECTRNFMDYANKTNQASYDREKGWTANPDNVILHSGTILTVSHDEYAKDDGDGFWRGLKTFFGGRLDGK